MLIGVFDYLQNVILSVPTQLLAVVAFAATYTIGILYLLWRS